MPAPQQSSIPTYKETANIPRPNVAYYLHDKRDSAGFQLAKLLNVTADTFGPKMQENREALEARDEATNVAHAQLGLGRLNRAQAAGRLDLITGDFEPDAFDMKQGTLQAAEFAGQLRDQYMAEEAYNMVDPNEFNSWLRGKVDPMIASAQDRSPSFYDGFARELGQNVELLTRQYAGRTQEVVANRSQEAFRRQLELAREADRYTTRHSEFGGWLKEFLGGESRGNWNAWFGNSGNTEDLSQLTLEQLLERQDQPGNDAAGLIQIVPGTLRGMIRDYGYSPSTRFTPQVQMEMALYLMNERGLGKWLKGELSDGAFADRLAGVWAAFRRSDGSGAYDNDGVNKATVDHETTAARLGQLRFFMEQNPELKALFTRGNPNAGDAELILGQGTSRTQTLSLLADEERAGVSNLQARDIYSEALSESIVKDGTMDLSPEAIEAEIKAARLNQDQATRVRQAAAERRQRNQVEERNGLQTRIAVTHEAIVSGSPEDLDGLRESSPQVYRALLERQSMEEPPELVEASAEWSASADYNEPGLPAKALRAYLGGELDRESYIEVVRQHGMVKEANAALRNPAIRDVVKSAKEGLHPSARPIFDRLIAATFHDLITANEGNRPTVASLVEAINQTAEIASARVQAEQERIMQRYGSVPSTDTQS